MSEQDRPAEATRRPSPRPRPTPGARTAAPGQRPSPRPRVAGSRRDREDDDRTAVPTAQATAETAAEEPAAGKPARRGASARRKAARGDAAPTRRRRGNRSRLTALVLAVLCVLAASGGGLLLWQRLHPAHVDPTVFSAARSGVEALYAYDYKDSKGSVARKLAVLTGDLEEQYRKDLSTGGIIDTYEQVSATTSYDVAEVGLQQVNPAQDQATVVVFGQYVVKSVNSGTQKAPSGSECTVTPDGAQACTQTVQVTMTKAGGGWKISELTLLTSS